MQIDHFTEDKPNPHWSIQESLDAYLYKDVYSDLQYAKLEQTILSQLDSPNTDTYKTHGTTFSFNNKKHNVVKHVQNDRDQLVVFDLTFDNTFN